MACIAHFFSTLSPFAYLTGTRLEEIAARHGVGVIYGSLGIMASFARTRGTPPDARHPSRMQYRTQERTRQTGARGMSGSPFRINGADLDRYPAGQPA